MYKTICEIRDDCSILLQISIDNFAYSIILQEIDVSDIANIKWSDNMK